MIFHEDHTRSIVKTVTYRILIIVSDSAVIYIITRRWDITIGFVTVANLVNTLLYFLHERAWNKIHWGKSRKQTK